jgi:hypothetical protein
VRFTSPKKRMKEVEEKEKERRENVAGEYEN